MRRALAAFVFILLAFEAKAFQPCPQFTGGWSQSYPAPITSVVYDETSKLLYVIWYSTFPTAYSGVPYTVMQTFSRTANPVQTYTSYVMSKYPSLLLQEQNACPVLAENGQFISTDELNTYVYALYLLLENGQVMDLQKGGPLWLNLPF